MIKIAPGLSLADDEVEIHFSRAGGPGGQNVNKVETAVRIRFDAAHSPSLPEPVRRRVIRLAGRRADRHGVITVQARRHRTQQANRRLALQILAELVRKAVREPRPRRKTSPTPAARRRRLETKRRRAGIKRLRRGPSAGDD